jgi:hypothetical protein
LVSEQQKSRVGARSGGEPDDHLLTTSRIRQFIESQLNAGGVRVKVVMELENEEAIERMVAIGVGSAFVIRRRASPKDSRFSRWKVSTCM